MTIVESSSSPDAPAPTEQTPPSRIDRTNVAALIPAYFEERCICDVAKRVKEQLDHVLVVDDGSTDKTEDEARKAGVQVLRHAVNQGKGAAIKTGLRELTTRPGLRYILILDGDGQHLPEEIPISSKRQTARTHPSSLETG